MTNLKMRKDWWGGALCNLTLTSLSHTNSMLQLCYDICADELPGYRYFGTQYSYEVRRVAPVTHRSMFVR